MDAGREDGSDDYHCPVKKNSAFEGTVCCICGDVGFQDQLFKCKKCVQRFQHSYHILLYCSSSYLQAGWKVGVCEWCNHYERKKRTPLPAAIACKRRNGEERVVRMMISRPLEERKDALHKTKPTDSCTDLWRSETAANTVGQCSTKYSEKSTCFVGNTKGKIVLSSSSARPSNRRYKLLKDVLC